MSPQGLAVTHAGSTGLFRGALHRHCSFKASELVSLENPAGQV